MGNNTYLVVSEDGAAAIVDPSFESAFIWDEITANKWKLELVLNTHAHIDHVVENAFFVERSGAPLAIHPDELPLLQGLAQQAAWLSVAPPRECEPTRMLFDDETIALGTESLTVVATPGHSPGGVSFLGE